MHTKEFQPVYCTQDFQPELLLYIIYMTSLQITCGPHKFSLCHTPPLLLLLLLLLLLAIIYAIMRNPRGGRGYSSPGADSPPGSVSDSPDFEFGPWLMSGCNLRARYFSTSRCVESTCTSPCSLDLHRLPKGMLCIMFALPSWRAVETW